MNTYEYDITYLAPMGAPNNQEEMNKLGARGFEIFNMERSQEGGLILYSRKELQTGKYSIPPDEYEYIESMMERIPGEPCQLCTALFGQHLADCPIHPDNIEESGAELCIVCGWIIHDNHTNEFCANNMTKEEESE